MIELRNDALTFSAPEVHPRARMSIDFQRTLRIPDDGKTYPLPPGLGRFPVRHVDDFAANVSESWVRHGGVMLPMYQAEALWLNFLGRYPFAVKIAAGKINAVTGESWTEGIHLDPQDYVVSSRQPWLDGFCVEKGKIRQFVAMPLGAGYTAEEQITKEAEFGGLQIVCIPMKKESYVKKVVPALHERSRSMSVSASLHAMRDSCAPTAEMTADMGLAPGGSMHQDIFDDPFEFSDWDLRHQTRCFVHLCNSQVWRQLTGANPPTTPPTSKEYTNAGLPWFEYYADGEAALEGSSVLGKLESVSQMGHEKGDVPLPENQSVVPEHVVKLREGLGSGQVREGTF